MTTQRSSQTDGHFLQDVWEINRAVGEAYGLEPADFKNILNSFPVFARKRPAFFAYVQQRLTEWKAGVPLEEMNHASISWAWPMEN